jgi:putative DNA primase/helicase
MTDVEQIAKALGGAHSNGDGSWSCRCPAHEDRSPSLSLSRRDGKLLWHCHAGCPQDAVTDALRARGLLPRSGNGAAGQATTAKKDDGAWHPVMPVPDGAPEPAFKHHRHGEPSLGWTYRDGADQILFYVVRFDHPDGRKEILPRCYGTLNGRTGWFWKAPAEPRPLYRLNQLAKRPPDTPILVVEGEKTVAAASEIFTGHVVMTWQGGSKAVAKADWTPLRGRNVVMWPDADDPGRKAARAVARQLPGLRVVDLPDDLPDGWDLAGR